MVRVTTSSIRGTGTGWSISPSFRVSKPISRHTRRSSSGGTRAKKNPLGWFRTIDRVTHSLVSRPKLLIPDIKNVFHPVLEDGQTYPHHNLYFISSDVWDLEVLGGILLSAVGQFFIEAYGVRMRGGYLRFQAQYLRRIRVPRPSEIAEAQAKMLVRAFREKNRALASEVALAIYGIDPQEFEA